MTSEGSFTEVNAEWRYTIIASKPIRLDPQQHASMGFWMAYADSKEFYLLTSEVVVSILNQALIAGLRVFAAHQDSGQVLVFKQEPSKPAGRQVFE